MAAGLVAVVVNSTCTSNNKKSGFLVFGFAAAVVAKSNNMVVMVLLDLQQQTIVEVSNSVELGGQEKEREAAQRLERPAVILLGVSHLHNLFACFFLEQLAVQPT